MIEQDRKTSGVRSIVGRVYALCLMLALLSCGFLAAEYLYRFLFRPVSTPPWVRQWEQHTDASLLRLAPAPPGGRAPLAQFHRMGTLPTLDRGNGCTLSG